MKNQWIENKLETDLYFGNGNAMYEISNEYLKA
jgi:hypothetical protein